MLPSDQVKKGTQRKLYDAAGSMMGKNAIHLLLVTDSFKSHKCQHHCEEAVCPNYHSQKDFRRPIRSGLYSKEKCKASCGEFDCPFAHNQIEQKYHPDNFKKRYCRDRVSGRVCMGREWCPLAHSDFELRLKPLHLYQIDLSFLFFRFKSEFCPFSWEKHDTFSCVYAHNWQDFKRPFFPELQAQICQNWKLRKRVPNYLDACPEGFSCKFCHGWKELDFHPERFRSINCRRCDGGNVSSEEEEREDDCEEETRPIQPRGKIELEKIEEGAKLLNRRICSYKHEGETAAVLTWPEFYFCKKREKMGPLTTQSFLKEVSLEGRSFEIPVEPPTSSVQVDFLVLSHQEGSDTSSVNSIFLSRKKLVSKQAKLDQVNEIESAVKKTPSQALGSETTKSSLPSFFEPITKSMSKNDDLLSFQENQKGSFPQIDFAKTAPKLKMASQKHLSLGTSLILKHQRTHEFERLEKLAEEKADNDDEDSSENELLTKKAVLK